MGCQHSVGCRPGRHDEGGEPHRNVRDIYKIGGVLGCGAFGQVRECVHKTSRKVYAIKIMTKTSSTARANNHHWSNEAMFRREVGILSQMEHPGIVQYHCFFEDHSYLYAILEKCAGGELFDYILRCGTVEDRFAASLAFQMLSALSYIHERGYVHRDVKAENFLFSTTPEAGEVKLIDFGMSEKLGEDQILSDVCGSPHYLAPELIRRKYGCKADVWALGVLIYLMLYGKYPFDGPSTSAIVKEILARKLDWGGSGSGSSSTAATTPTRVTETAQSFLRTLLQRNPEKRLSAREALKHPWLAGAWSLTSPLSSPRLRLGDAAEDEAVVPPDEDEIDDIQSNALIVIGQEETRYSQRCVGNLF